MNSLPKQSLNQEEEKVFNNFSDRYNDLNSNSGNSGNNSSYNDISNNTSSNPYSNLTPLPFKIPNQNMFLINIAHRKQNPRSKVAGFRICGAFENIDRLKKHVEKVGGAPSYGGVNLLKADAHVKFLICSSFEKQQNSDYTLQKINDISQKYIKTLDFHNQEFKMNKENRQQGKTGLSNQEKIIKKSSRKTLLDKKFDSETTQAQESGEVSRTAELRNQSVAVISILDDCTPHVLNGLEDPEPIIIIWGCFEDEKQAKHYIYNTASKQVTDVVLDVVNMYEWVIPSEINAHIEEINEEYRNPSLNNVMKARKTQKASVMSFEDYCRKEQQTAPTIEFTTTKNEDGKITTEIKKPDELKISVSMRNKDENDDKNNDNSNNNTDNNTSVNQSFSSLENKSGGPRPQFSTSSSNNALLNQQLRDQLKDQLSDQSNNNKQPSSDNDIFEKKDWMELPVTIDSLYNDKTFKNDKTAEKQ